MPSKKTKSKKKNTGFIGKKTILVIVFSVVFTTLGIKASDTLFTDKKKNESENGFCPKGMVLIPYSQGDFCIDIYEASAGENCSFPDPLNQGESRANLDDPDCQPISEAGKFPWRNISQDQAMRACSKTGKRLATNREWMQAALGTPDLNSEWSSRDCQVDNNWNKQPGLSGSGDKCLSSYGVYDMIGNVWEWVEGVVEDGAVEGRALPEAGYIDSTDGQALPGLTNPNLPNPDYNNDYLWLKTSGLRGMVRGGYWNNKSGAGLYSLYAVTPPSSVEPGIGFRCVK